MRKRNVNFCADTIMWYVIYLFPLLLVLFACFTTPISDIYTFLEELDFSVLESTSIYTFLSSAFVGDFALFGGVNHYFLLYATYFVCVLLLHLAVDVLAFIPRFAHNLFGKAFQED